MLEPHDVRVEYALAVALAIAHLVVVGLTAWAVFVISFWSENVTPEEAAENDWLAWFSPLLLLVAVVVLAGAMLRRWRVGALALIVEVVAAAILVGYALGESVHSDGKLILFGGCVLLVAAASVAFSAASAVRH